MRSILKTICNAVLATLTVCTFMVGVGACPPTGVLTITYSWGPTSLVHIHNSGVPSGSVSSGYGGWNTMNALYECFGPTFIADSNSAEEQINLSFTSIPNDPTTGATVRGKTHLDTATFTLGRLASVNVDLNSQLTNTTTIGELFAHELGHTQGLFDCTRCGLHSSVMEAGDAVSNINDSTGLSTPTLCDIQKVESVATDYACPPGGCNGQPDYTLYASTGCQSGFTVIDGVCTRSYAFQSRCAEPSGYDPYSCTCPDGTTTSPIIIDLDGKGFSMTDASSGVLFNILSDDVPLQLSWTASSSNNAFLALDRNGNGTIDNGGELFGNLTAQPVTPKPNGFVALAVFDKQANGGNGNGRIDSQDSVFARLKLWQDLNHNGISEPGELTPLLESLSAIDLDYKEARRTDRNGNEFRFRSKVYDLNGEQTGRWAWDVFLTVQ